MFRDRLIYRVFLILLLFGLTLLASLYITTYGEMRELLKGDHSLVIGKRLISDLLSVSFYVFILAFLLSLFLSRKLLLPVRELHRAARNVRDGNLRTAASLSTYEEFEEVIVAFNEMVTSLRDKTEELVRKNNDIRESRDYLETIMNSIEDEIIILDRDLRIIRANRVVYERSGKRDAAGDGPGIEGIQVVGEFCHRISHGMPGPCFLTGEKCPAKEVFETGAISRAVHEHNDISGGKRAFEILACPIKDGRGNVMNVVELLRDVTDMKRIEEALSEKNKELTALNSIASILSSSLKTEDIFGSVLDKLVDMMHMDGGGIFVLDRERSELVCAHHKGISEEFVKVAGRVPLGEDIPGKVAATGQVITTADAGTDERIGRSVLRDSGIKGYCCIPIRETEKIVGVFCLFSFRPHLFTPEEERLLASVGDMTGIAIENIGLYDEMSALYEYQHMRRKTEHKNLLSLSSRLASSIDIKEAMDTTIDLIKGFFEADVALLLTVDRENRLVVKSFLGDIERAEYGCDGPFGRDSIEWRAFETRRPLILPGPSSSPFASSLPFSSQAAVAVPIYVGEKTLGAFSLYFTAPRDLREEDLHFLQTVSSILAVSMERSDYYEKLLLEKSMAEVVFNSMSDGLYTVDRECVITTVNRAAERMLGVPSSRLVGKKCMDVIAHRHPSGDEPICGRECPLSCAVQGISMSGDMDYIDPSGKRVSFSVSSAPLIDPKGELIGAVQVFRDITREKEIDRMKTDFVRTVSHEFRTPLSAVIGMTEMLIEKEVDEDRSHEYMQIILSEGKRLSSMVSDLLDISRIESGEDIFNEGDVDFNLLLHDTMKTFSDIIGKKEIGMEIRVSDDVRGFRGDGDKLKQLFVNLIGNSATYSDKGCLITVSVRREEETVKIEVSDTGWGIPDTDIPLLTRKFFRGKHGVRTKGTGLGLSLCREIAHLHGGTLLISSRPGTGTTVTVDLPWKKPLTS